MIGALLAVLLAACTDYGHVVNVAPSAASKYGEIELAAAHVNALLGTEHFTVRMVDTGRMVDGEIVVRLVDALPAPQLAHSWYRVHGDLIELLARDDAITIGHELGHCGGLAHVEDRANLMFHASVRERGWKLSEQQVDTVLNGGRP